MIDIVMRWYGNSSRRESLTKVKLGMRRNRTKDVKLDEEICYSQVFGDLVRNRDVI